MSIKFKIFFHPDIYKDIKNIPKQDHERIRKAIEIKLKINPQIYGIPLRGSLKLFYKLRVGDYRIVFKISGGDVFVLAIGHRKNIYEITERRNKNKY